MKIQEISISKFKWEVKVLTDVSCNDLAIINKELDRMNCHKELVDKANEQFSKCKDNIGMSYSNNSINQTLIIIGKTEDKEQFINTLFHEVYHFIDQLSVVSNIKDIEQKATLIGTFAMQLTNIISDTLKELK